MTDTAKVGGCLHYLVMKRLVLGRTSQIRVHIILRLVEENRHTLIPWHGTFLTQD